METQKQQETVLKPEGGEYQTTDQLMVEVLTMAGFDYLSVLPDNHGQLVYTFETSRVWTTVEQILSGKANEMTFSYADWWKAKLTWQMNLRHLSSVRRRQ